MNPPEDIKKMFAGLDDKANLEAVAQFKIWMARTEVKLMVSMIPRSEPPELLETLLRCAFDRGAEFGRVFEALNLTEILFMKGKGD